MHYNSHKRHANCPMEALKNEILGLSAKRRNYYNLLSTQIHNLLGVIDHVNKNDDIEQCIPILERNIKAGDYVVKIDSGHREFQHDLNRFRKNHLKSISSDQEIEYALSINDLNEKLFCQMIGMHFLHLGYFDIYKEFAQEVFATFNNPISIHQDIVEAYALLHKMLKHIDNDNVTLAMYWVNTTQGLNTDSSNPHSLRFKLLKLQQLSYYRDVKSPDSILNKLESSDLSKFWKTHRIEIGKIISKFILDDNYNTEYDNLKSEIKKQLTRAYCDHGIYSPAQNCYNNYETRQLNYFDSVSDTSDQSEGSAVEQWNNDVALEASMHQREDNEDDDSDTSTQSLSTTQITTCRSDISNCHCTIMYPMQSLFENNGELVDNWLTSLDFMTATNTNTSSNNRGFSRLFRYCKSCDLNETQSIIDSIYNYTTRPVRRFVRPNARVNQVGLELSQLVSNTNVNVNSGMTVVPTFAFTLLAGEPDDNQESENDDQDTTSSNRRHLSISRILNSIRHQETRNDNQILQRILVANEPIDEGSGTSNLRISPAREIIATGSNITLRDILHMIIRGFRTRTRPRASRRPRTRSTVVHKLKSKKKSSLQESPGSTSSHKRITLPHQSALSLIFTAGYITHPRLVEVLGLVFKERCEAATKVSNWLKSKRQLPLESDLGSSFHFHSHITCAVSKDQTCKSNPPVMLPCGHVICQYCVDKLCKNKARQNFRCPMCPTLVEFHQTKILDIA
ncbi:LisH domain-containing protein C29A3.03c [Babesia microti strain RI]|uniref:LisH domain-containing protein C29A3.03c n=1 Tax=Babesia microti (strain RI) TaxID=1133968 RepID=A0A1R4ACB7_BABMR|nr:LisH domain-containing protein C29A3.03c [Babesia microti strain RI]SJK86628.1 LisH domain-containing protein C29A3.03c [Babesia microti strain RI]|eukprot:XP_012649407.2 LisH domain-containing protein C29A3.03c [Babesia microti strain RI]